MPTLSEQARAKGISREDLKAMEDLNNENRARARAARGEGMTLDEMENRADEITRIRDAGPMLLAECEKMAELIDSFVLTAGGFVAFRLKDEIPAEFAELKAVIALAKGE